MRRTTLRRLAVAMLALAAFSIGAARAPAAILDGETTQSGFAPCNWQGGGPPPIETCVDTAPKVQATCDPAGDSTISITRSGTASGIYNGTYSETLTATIGPQTAPAAPAFQPLATSGIQAGTIGFHAGLIRSLTATFDITSYDGQTTIHGTKTLVDNLANTGVCVVANNEFVDSPVFTGNPLSGYFVLLNAQVLSYTAEITTNGGTPVTDSGVAETYLANSFATCCAGTAVASSQGHLLEGLGTSHPAEGTTPSAPTPAGTNVPVTPAPGVTLTFDNVTAAGDTSVTALQTAPPLPAGIQAGSPPMFYEISTTATFAPGSVRICVPYGSAPAGTTPVLMHYENGAWVAATALSYDDLTRIVCGSVTSFSPFAAAFRDAAPASTADCKDGGWKRFTSPSFKNQGDCVSYVAAKGKKN